MFPRYLKYASLLASAPLISWCQAPVIFPGGIVNSASYATAAENDDLVGRGVGFGLAAGSVASIFGANLAVSKQTAQTLPLPTELAGTVVTVYGVNAPLFYVSPGLINFQMPFTRFQTGTGVQLGHPAGVVVSTPAGASNAYQIDFADAFGIFTLDSSGCGPGVVQNVKPDGSISLNSPSNSASPGDFIVIYGTGLGLVYGAPPDGSPTPSSPLTKPSEEPSPVLDFASEPVNIIGPNWAGLAPGMVGVVQINIQIPNTVREGCAVPLQVQTDAGASQPVTIAIRNGGGPCADPPSAGYGQITWEKRMTTILNSGGADSTTETDSLTVSLQASPGRQVPAMQTYTEDMEPRSETFFGPSCPVPGYRSLNAGNVTVHGPGFGPAQVPAAPLQSGPVGGLSQYQIALPNGTIQPGSFVANAAGGVDVGAFQSSAQIGTPIQITTPLAGLPLPYNQPLQVNWTGGDSSSLVTIYLISHNGSTDQTISYQGRASDGTIFLASLLFFGAPPTFGITIGPDTEIVVEVTPDPAQVSPLAVAGLSLGGQHTWKYSYHFGGIMDSYTTN
jgi:uncharacterized protein (TIGR03437 family)